MKIIIYDCEVFAFDWLVVFKDKESGDYTVIHNDNEALHECLRDDEIYISFNGKHYDSYIIKAICGGFSPQEVKAVNDFIIGGGQGWECPMLLTPCDTIDDEELDEDEQADSYWWRRRRHIDFRFNNVDIKDDMQMGLSLKAIEGHLGMSVEETTVPFDIDRPLTEDELKETLTYCIHDVDTTEKLVELRKDYLRTKLNLGKRAGIPEVKALSATNAKLTAMMLRAKRKEWNDGRNYVYPKALDKSVIPHPILEFFETIHDLSIPDEQLFKTSFKIEIGGMPCKYSWGGVHGSLTGYYEEVTEDRVIQNRDVFSLYPSLIEIYNYLSRNVPDPEVFYAMKRDRIEAKHNGDSQTAKDLKLPLNTVSGAQENRYNDLYDPLPTRSLRISGQLFLTVLAMRLLNSCETIRLINLNTDGLAYSVDKSELWLVDKISHEWEVETKFELEVDDVQKVWVKDVNNLLMVKTDGAVKTVGGYLNYGISEKGAWAINNNMIIVKKALIEYFVNGTPVEDTINSSADIFDFQIIAKAGTKYKEAYHLVDDEKVSVQKVNRVYAAKDARYGKLFKVKTEDDSTAKIEMLPDHCIIDNDNHLAIEDVDKQFYIDLAKKRINDFLGIKPEKIRKERKKKTMATATKAQAVNIYKRLAIVREKFLEAGVKKAGKNMQLKSMYFTLDDIVPIAMSLFHEQNLLPVTNFTKEDCVLTIIDMEDEANRIEFTAPMREYMGNAAVTPVQALGATITYMRRYLYQQALDIVETDEMESGTMPNLSKPAASKAPASEEKRAEVKQNLTNPEGDATPLQITQLKKKLKELREKCGKSADEWVAKIAIETSSFTVITKNKCEEILLEVGKKLAEG